MRFEINGLIRETFKKHKLEDYGFGFMDVSEPPEGKKPLECMDKLTSLTVAKADQKKLDKLSARQYGALYLDCIKEVYGAEDEEKNLSTSGTASPGTKKK